ncbi:major facilitator superfamily domain-containing protein [Glomus cerebriforme]|uniref:Major facilitator superfamily domain-containing protein n=1 Tax=Glomus cerebriforme TaxID=658196 RepID=A0A397TBS2_9GLOM|nr:major facilitator superfamily domain-containing protein [Glomus cerebriforme]
MVLDSETGIRKTTLRSQKPVNPLKILRSLNKDQTITFLAAYLGWTLDAFDFFTVSFALPYIAKEFKMEPSTISASITVTLMFRPVGALIFGLLGDRFGRKYLLMADILLFSSMELASGFAPNFQSFVIIRAIFGLAMGGEWGLGAALTMEILPPEARGLVSGILQQGYPTGYIIAAIFYYLVTVKLGWRAMFWIGSFPALLVIILRFFVPESQLWKKSNENRKSIGRDWLIEIKLILKHHWLKIIHTILLMACFNFVSHGTQDLYPTYLKTQLLFSPEAVTVTAIIANIGALVGGAVCGYSSQYLGRRRTIIIAMVLLGAFLPLFVLPRSRVLLTIGAFFVYFFVQGAYGIVPAHLNELSPPEFRATFPGFTYQLGVLIASSSAQIEAVLGEKFPKDGLPNYGLTQAILTACAAFCLIILALIGKEAKDVGFDGKVEDEIVDDLRVDSDELKKDSTAEKEMRT